jgi:hypothetical protein
MITQLSAYDELADLMVSMNPAKIIEFKASPALQRRFEELVEKEKNKVISTEEKNELDRILMVNHVINLAKIRAHQQLAQ